MNNTPAPVRILHLDGNPADLQLIKALIDEANHDLPASVESVSTKEAYLAALRSCAFDLILSDYRMPGYDGDQALKDARAICPAVPFIMVTGELGEERAIETLKAGATDYVLKDRIRRLIPSIKRALKDVTLERKRRESEEKYRQIIETAQEGIWTVDADRHTLFVNERLAAMLGSTVQEMMERPWTEFVPHQEHRQGSDQRVQERKEGMRRFPESYEMELKRKDGSTLWAIVNSTPLFNGQGEYAGSISMLTDITERKRTEEQLEQSNQRINQIMASIQDDFYVLDRNWVFVYASRLFTERIGKEPKDFVGKNIWEMFPKHLGTVFEENFRAAMDKGEIRRFEVCGKYTNAWYSMAVFPSAEGITVLGSDITERKLVEVKLAESEKKYRDLFEKMSEGFLLVEPIFTEAGAPVSYYYRDANLALEQLTHLKRTEIIGKTGHEVLGVVEPHWVECFARVARSGKSERIEEHSEALGGWYSVHVYCPRPGMAALIYTNVTEQRRAAEALAVSERKYRELLETANSIILRWDSQGVIRFINDYGLRFFGYTREELVGRDVMMIAPKVETSTGRNLESLVNDILRHPERYTDHANENIRKDGTTVWVAWTNKVIFDEQCKGQEVLAIGNDITALKEAEGALAAAYNQIQSIIDNTPAIVYALDLEERFVIANTALAELLNSTPDAILGKRRHEFMPKEDADRHEANDRQVIETGKAMEFEEYSALQDRAITWLTTKFPLRDAQGKIYAVAGISADISERKRVEEALQESEARFHALAENIPQLAWMTDETGGIFWYNQRWYDYTGTTLEEMKGWGWQKVHHPDHVDRVTAKFRGALEEAQSWEDTFPLRSKTGEYRWFLSRAFAIKDEQGKVKSWFGTNTDITDQRQAAEALKASEENLRLMVSQATEAMMVLDSRGVIEAVSELGERLLGYDEGELVGKCASDFAVTFSRLEATLTLDELRRTAPNAKTVSARIKTKSGEAQLMGLTVRLLNAGTKAEKYFVTLSKVDLPSKWNGPPQ